MELVIEGAFEESVQNGFEGSKVTESNSRCCDALPVSDFFNGEYLVLQLLEEVVSWNASVRKGKMLT